ncbi:sulfate ABC transporter permease subunit CysW [Bartonella sp. HY329]|uniref:sulfate ABC transporter permease subunit CysW n=1 Tax=unclassified Bartonella TaxID=2645622 RepID=UPI0021C71EED|nr:MULTISPECIES: sulfate ABC transporter permease subunit CysW [unclassified Bartonella]UXM94456.1 sulfate ABC transporter permease subunit CysW [Bartonella sp. HY329]UXN08780.1 sulfate ABC transporter permease subunit CysW [Bartonella sp. HY328]
MANYSKPQNPPSDPTSDNIWFKWIAIAVVLLFLTIMLFLPLAIVFVEALGEGFDAYWQAISEASTLNAIKLTLIVALIAVTCNSLIGILGAWAITKFRFRGKAFVITLIDLPFSISPVIAGLALILVFSMDSVLRPVLEYFNIEIIYALPGMILATMFVTFPFVARELIPLMQDQGTSDEEAALSLGASGFKTFWLVTLPNIKWALLYGILLCNARAMGEFGAVYLVSSRIEGESMTLPLQIELMYYSDITAACAIATLLTSLALVTLVLKTLIEKIYARKGARTGH